MQRPRDSTEQFQENIDQIAGINDDNVDVDMNVDNKACEDVTQDQESDQEMADLDVAEQQDLAKLVGENLCQRVKSGQNHQPSQRWIN